MGTSNEKGALLEKIIEKLCADDKAASVTQNCKVKGKSGTERQIDVLINTRYKSFDIKIIVEAKNHSRKVDIDTVEAFTTKLQDVGGNLGVIVCPLGFTEGAINSAKMHDIQLYQVFDKQLNNTQLVPWRFVSPYPVGHQIEISSRASGGAMFSLPMERSVWRFIISNRVYKEEDLLAVAWNNKMIPHRPGVHTADFGVVKIADSETLKTFYYLELKLSIDVKEDCFLKLFSVSAMRNVQSNKGNHSFYIDLYSTKEKMVENGWKYYENQAEMEKDAEKYDTYKDAKKLRTTEEYVIDGHDGKVYLEGEN